MEVGSSRRAHPPPHSHFSLTLRRGTVSQPNHSPIQRAIIRQRRAQPHQRFSLLRDSQPHPLPGGRRRRGVREWGVADKGNNHGQGYLSGRHRFSGDIGLSTVPREGVHRGLGAMPISRRLFKMSGTSECQRLRYKLRLPDYAG